MRVFVIAILLMPLTLLGGDHRRHGDWGWPPSLEKLWAPIVARTFSMDAESDQGLAAVAMFAEHYRYFAQHARPEVVIRDMIADLRAHPSGTHFRIYAQVMQQWPPERVLAILRPFEYSLDDPVLRQLIPFHSALEDAEVARIAHDLASLIRVDQ